MRNPPLVGLTSTVPTARPSRVGKYVFGRLGISEAMRSPPGRLTRLGGCASASSMVEAPWASSARSSAMPFWFVQVRRASAGAGGPTVTDVGPVEEQPTAIRAATAATRILRCPMGLFDAMCNRPVPAGPKWGAENRHPLPAVGDACLSGGGCARDLGAATCSKLSVRYRALRRELEAAYSVRAKWSLGPAGAAWECAILVGVCPRGRPSWVSGVLTAGRARRSG